MLNLCGVVVFHRSVVNWRRGPLVYVHFCICETCLLKWYSIHLLSVGGGGLDICAFCYMYNIFDLVVIHTSWEGVHVPEVYVHSAIC